MFLICTHQRNDKTFRSRLVHSCVNMCKQVFNYFRTRLYSFCQKMWKKLSYWSRQKFIFFSSFSLFFLFSFPEFVCGVQITGNSVLDSSRVHRGPGMPSRLRGARTAQLEPRDRLTSARKLLWAPSNIISSVFDVFRKVSVTLRRPTRPLSSWQSEIIRLDSGVIP